MTDELSPERIAEARVALHEGGNRSGLPWDDYQTILAALALADRSNKAPRYYGTSPDHPQEVAMVVVDDIERTGE